MDEIKVLLTSINKGVRKNLYLLISIMGLFFVIGMATIFFYNPPARFNQAEIQAKERDRVLLEKQNAAFKALVAEQQKSINFFSQRDSMLQKEIRLNRKAIENIKIPDEKIYSIQRFSSAELQQYFANLPDSR